MTLFEPMTNWIINHVATAYMAIAIT